MWSELLRLRLPKCVYKKKKVRPFWGEDTSDPPAAVVVGKRTEVAVATASFRHLSADAAGTSCDLETKIINIKIYRGFMQIF